MRRAATGHDEAKRAGSGLDPTTAQVHYDISTIFASFDSSFRSPSIMTTDGMERQKKHQPAFRAYDYTQPARQIGPPPAAPTPKENSQQKKTVRPKETPPTRHARRR